MSIQFIACFFAVAIGSLFSGSISSLWAAFNDEAPHIGLLQEGGVFAPMKGLVVALSAPIGLLRTGAITMADEPGYGMLYLLAGMALSLFLGVFILTAIFGMS
jgi:hypothetical protein